MNKFDKISILEADRCELHDKLNLTGAEISVNVIPAGSAVPFIHSHKVNEEIYAVLDGKGTAVIDGVNIAITVGDWMRVSPSANRQLFASENKALKYICIQVKADSLEGYTSTDAILQ